MARGGEALQRLASDQIEALVRPAQEGADGPTTFVLADRGTADDARVARVLQEAAGDHSDRVKVAAAPADLLVARLQAWQEHRRAFDTFDFRRWPAVLVFRGGRLVTTFHPRHVFFAEKLQQREEREQLEIFLSKMVYFDPTKVKEQKNLEREAGV